MPVTQSPLSRGRRRGASRRGLLALPLAALVPRPAGGQNLIDSLRRDPAARLFELGRDDLARAFVAVAFGSDPGIGTPPRERLRRFQTPMEIAVVGEAAANYVPWVVRHVEHLVFLTGQPIRIVTDRPANVLLVLSPDPARFVAGTPWREMLGRAFASQSHVDDFFASLRPETLARSLVSHTVLTGDDIRYSIVAINTAHQPSTIWAAIVEELSQILGLLGDDPDLVHSIFNDFSPYMDLTEQDRWLLRMLYHPAVRPGMTRREAQRAAMAALANMGYGVGQSVPATGPAAAQGSIHAPSSADVARNFLRIAFPRQGAPPGARRAALARWEDGIRVALVTDEDSAKYRGWAEIHVAQLGHTTGQSAGLVPAEAANLLVVLGADPAALLRQAELRTVLAQGFGDVEGLIGQVAARAATMPCFRLTAFHDTARTRPRAAVLVVSSRGDLSTVWGYVVQETAAALGMFGRDDEVEWTVFNERLPYVNLTGQDLAFLRLLYDPALRAGMSREAVEAAICRSGPHCR